MTPEEQAERDHAIAQRNKIARIYTRKRCPTCCFYGCLCEELTDPNRKDEAQEHESL